MISGLAKAPPHREDPVDGELHPCLKRWNAPGVFGRALEDQLDFVEVAPSHELGEVVAVLHARRIGRRGSKP